MTSDPRQIQLIMELRKQGITDNRVLGAMERTPRELFVDAPFVENAYRNTALPIACGQTISQPYIVAYITQHLEVDETMRVLEIGTGSGYQAAILSPLCRRVYTIERHRPLLDEAKQRFKKLNLHNVVPRHGDGFAGWPEQAPFDRIVLSCAVPEVPKTLIDQLKVGGILIAPIGSVPNSDTLRGLESISQQLTKMIRTQTGVTEEVLIPVVFVPMLSGLP
jgi:protein-L-isoaspartate(D-aspartate) O-methyltransferase